MKKKVAYILKHHSYLAVYFTILGCFITSSPLFAQSDSTNKLKEVKVTTSVMPKQQVIVPSQSVSANDFTRYNALNVADAIRDFSGVIIKDYGGIGGLKTISVRGLGANHTSVLFDGVQINDAENGQVDLSKLNINGIQQITLYNAQPPNILQTARAFAAASVLAIETVKPHLGADKPYQITAGVKAGSFGLFNPYMQWQQRINNNWAFIINSYIQNANGYYKYFADEGQGTATQKRTGSEVAIQQIDGAVIWNNANNKLNIHINYYNADRGVPGAVIRYTTPATVQKIYNRDFYFQGTYEHDWINGLQLLVNTKFSQNQLFYFDPHFLNSSGGLDQHFSQREYYQSAALAYAILPYWSVSYSADFALNNLNANLYNFRYPTRVTLLNVLATNLILSGWTLQASLLNANINESVKIGTATPNYNIYAPTLIATVRPFADKNFQLRCFYKYIYRMPTFNDQYYNFVSNLDLKPEFVNQYDAGISYTKNLPGFLSYLTFTTDAYYNYVTNKLVFIPTLYNGYTQNAGKVDIKGVDASIKTLANLSSSCKLNLSVNYSYQQALYVDANQPDYLNRLPYIPLHTVAINAGITAGRIGVFYNQILSSSRYYQDNSDLSYLTPAHGVSDASVNYKAKQFTISAGVNNLFNKSYEVVRSYPMPGRSYTISFQITI